MDVDEVKTELEDLGQAGFIDRYGRFYLVLTDLEALESFAGFVNTASRDSNDILSGKKKLDNVDIRPLVPRTGAGSVTIGREDADIELSSKKISKVHAIFTVDGGLPSLTDTGFEERHLAQRQDAVTQPAGAGRCGRHDPVRLPRRHAVGPGNLLAAVGT